MKRAVLSALAVLLTPSVAFACPYAHAAASAASDCGACGSSTFGYGVSLLVGLAVGFGSVAMERHRRS